MPIKIKQINNKANHLLEFEYTLLGSTSTCTRTCTWNSVLVLVLVLVNFASTCTCTCTCTLCTCDITVTLLHSIVFFLLESNSVPYIVEYIIGKYFINVYSKMDDK